MNLLSRLRRLLRIVNLLLILGLVGGPVWPQPAWAAPLKQDSAAAVASTTYTVQRGDTLYSLARRFNTTVQTIMSANKLTGTTIYIGQRLVIPGSASNPGGTAQRIQFAAGTTAATVQGNVQSPTRVEYLLAAQAKQTMHVNLTSPNGKVNFALQGVQDGQPLKRLENSDTTWSGALPATQDYLLQVATTLTTTTSFSLTVKIEPLP